MDKPALWIVHNERDVKVNLKGEFDGLYAFEHIHDSLPPVDCFNRLILDFSQASGTKPIELLYFLEDLKDDPCFNNIEICIHGLRFSYMDTACPNGGKTQLLVQGEAGS